MAEIIVKKDGRKIRFFKSEFQSLSDGEKKELYELRHKEGYNLFCTCSKNNQN